MSLIPINQTFQSQQSKLVKASVKRAVINNINVGTRTADVYFVENPQTVIRNIPIASGIDVASISVGMQARVDTFDETNPNNMVISYVMGQASPKTVAQKRFIDLTDVPQSYVGAAGNFVKVLATEDGLEFVAGGGGGNIFARTATFVVVASNATDLVDGDFFCTGTSDELVIQQALDALPANGGRIILSDGTFNISFDAMDGFRIKIQKPGITIQGQGQGTIMKFDDGLIGDQTMIYNGDQVPYLKIRDIFFDGNWRNISVIEATDGGLVRLGPKAEVSGCVFYNSCGYAIVTGLVDGGETSANTGGDFIHHNDFLECHPEINENTSYIIALNDAYEGAVISDNFFEETTNPEGIWIADTARFASVDFNKVTNNYFHSTSPNASMLFVSGIQITSHNTFLIEGDGFEGTAITGDNLDSIIDGNYIEHWFVPVAGSIVMFYGWNIINNFITFAAEAIDGNQANIIGNHIYGYYLGISSSGLDQGFINDNYLYYFSGFGYYEDYSFVHVGINITSSGGSRMNVVGNVLDFDGNHTKTTAGHLTVGIAGNANQSNISNNIISDSNIGITFGSPCIVANNVLVGNFYGIWSAYVDPSGSGSATGVTGAKSDHSIISHNFIYGQSGSFQVGFYAFALTVGDEISGTSLGNVIEGNIIQEYGWEGIRLLDCSYATINANVLQNVGKVANNAYAAILITNGVLNSTYNTLNGNTVRSSYSNKHRYGIRENSSSDGPNIMLGNILRNAVTANLSTLNASTIKAHNITT